MCDNSVFFPCLGNLKEESKCLFSLEGEEGGQGFLDDWMRVQRSHFLCPTSAGASLKDSGPNSLSQLCGGCERSSLVGPLQCQPPQLLPAPALV